MFTKDENPLFLKLVYQLLKALSFRTYLSTLSRFKIGDYAVYDATSIDAYTSGLEKGNRVCFQY